MDPHEQINGFYLMIFMFQFKKILLKVKIKMAF